jgi:DNA-directed RNA polymerase subunit RPC12/RpoP
MENNVDFIMTWDHYTSLGAYICIGIAILILLYHECTILLIKDYKEKYDYVNLNEIRYFWYAVIALITGAAFYANSIGTKMIFSDVAIWFYVRIFMTASFAVIAYFIFYSLIRIYYPRYVEKRLNRLRHKPRRSPSGNLMRKLREKEEEAHLEPELFKEQNEVHSVDYDVWLDEQTGYKKVEKYSAYQHTIECPECGYVTFSLRSEEIAEDPTENERGILIKHYRCSYCNHREARESVVAKLSENIV